MGLSSFVGPLQGFPLCPSDISPKYDKKNLGCELSSGIVGFGGDSAISFFTVTGLVG